MPDLFVGIGGIVVLLGSIVLGAPIMLALTAVGFLGVIVLKGIIPATAILGTIFFSVVNGFHFSVIPMFLLMGFFAMRAGIGTDLFDAAQKWLGRLPGGLAVASTGSAAAFGAASGSSVGTATLFTRLALPEMIDRGYDRGFAAASIAIAGTLAVLIPPSALMVVYGILTDSGIGKLLIAGILPGLVFSVLLIGTIIVIALMSPEKAPADTARYSMGEKLWSLRMVGPLVAVIAVMLGGLYGGVFTPSEAGGVGAFVTFVMAIIRQRGLRGLELGRTLMETVTLTAMIFAIIVGGLLFARFLALSGASGAIKDVLVSGSLSPFIVVTIVTLIYLVLGTLMDAPSLLAISLPITYPVMTGLGYDPLWFGVYVVILAEIGAVTPPVGINCFVVKGAAGNLVTLEEIFGGLWPFLLAGVAMLVLMNVWPDMALLLPRSM